MDGKRYQVRQPGQCAWGEADDLQEAERLRREAIERLGDPVIVYDTQTGETIGAQETE